MSPSQWPGMLFPYTASIYHVACPFHFAAKMAFFNIIVLKVQISDGDHKTKQDASQGQSLDSLKAIQWSCEVLF
jgi:hypothetical protein